MNREQLPLDETGIEGILPHRRPFMFLGSVYEIEPGIRAKGVLADLTKPDFDFLKGHFPRYQVVPGGILMEALAELLGIAAVSGMEADSNKIGILVEDKMRYKQMIYPGDHIRLEAEITAMRMDIVKGKVQASKEGKVAAFGEITAKITDRPSDLTTE